MLLQNNKTISLNNVDGLEILGLVEQKGTKLLDWAEENKIAIEEWLQNKGCLILRGLKLSSSKQFGKLLKVIFDSELLSYEHRSTPRTELKENIYTATEYRSDQLIVQHNEQAYTNIWPMRIGFYCMLPSTSGGATPIADSREVLKSIPDAIKEKFIEKDIMYVRNYSDIDLPWTEVFCTDDKNEVEKYCKTNDIEYEWLNNNGLRTKQILPATKKHPITQEELWFNQAHLFHHAALNKEIRDSLIATRGKENLPRNAYYGDGSEIAEETIQTIIDIYENIKISFPWSGGDVLLLDNMLFSHGREPFVGERRVLVGMAQANKNK